jgi:hypothetical protein
MFEIYNALNVLIAKYEDYLSAERDLKMHLNYNINIKFLLGKIFDKSVEFLNELKTNHFSKFLAETKIFTEKLLDSYLPFQEFEHLNILEELRVEENMFAGTVELKQNIIIMYDLYEKSDQKMMNERKIKLNFEESITPKYIIPLCRWVNLKSKLVISGGIYKNSEGLEITVKNVYYLDFEIDSEKETFQRKVFKLPDMFEARDQHCFISLNDFYLLCIGGSKTDSCEMFNFLTNEWTKLPDLDKPRYNSSAYVHNNLEVYLFFGLIGEKNGPKRDQEGNMVKKDLQFTDSIMKLKLYSSSNKELYWEEVKYRGERINVCLSGIIGLNENTVYILGGRVPGENNYSNQSFAFDPETHSVTNGKVTLPKKLCFLECNFLNSKHNDFNFVLYSSDFHLVKMKI